MIQLLSLGLLSGLFFSSSFILNRMMSLEGGHWIWSASLRYGFMIIFLLLLIALFQGPKTPLRIMRLFARNWLFWTLAGSIGFGGFYALICYSADHAPGWIIASTWQLTIIASLVVLVSFGRSFPKKVWLFSLISFTGVLLVNCSHADLSNIQSLLMGVLPVLVAAFCYPIGNQLVWEAKNGNPSLPCIYDPLLENTFNKVLLLSLGSVPFWLVIIGVGRPQPPSQGQIINTALVALFSGIIATSLFLLARNRSKKPSELAAVDATQSSEVIFAMAGEMILLGTPFPNMTAVAGILLVFTGLFFFIRFQETESTAA
jgi:drug/metabolite transporter (DMT)-like permease